MNGSSYQSQNNIVKSWKTDNSVKSDTLTLKEMYNFDYKNYTDSFILFKM